MCNYIYMYIVNSIISGGELIKPLASISMEVEKVFHMNGGVGDTSYHENSSLQVIN